MTMKVVTAAAWYYGYTTGSNKRVPPGDGARRRWCPIRLGYRIVLSLLHLEIADMPL